MIFLAIINSSIYVSLLSTYYANDSPSEPLPSFYPTCVIAIYFYLSIKIECIEQSIGCLYTHR